MKIKYGFVIGTLMFLLLLNAGHSAVTASLYDSAGNIAKFTYTSENYYSGDFIIEICNGTNPVSGNVSLIYHVGNASVVVAKSSATSTEVFLPVSSTSGCVNSSTFMTIGTSADVSDYWSYSLWPARLWVVVSSDNKLDTYSDNSYMQVPQVFDGTYSYDIGHFNYTTGNITMTLKSATIIYYDNGVRETKTFTSTPTGYNTTHSIITYGVCSDSYGVTCYSSNSGEFNNVVNTPISLYTGHPNMNDKEVYTVYYVVNGYGYPIHLGADLKPVITAPSNVYYGEKVPVNVSVLNEGNVPVTDSFNVTLSYNESGTVTQYTKLISGETILPGQSYVVTFDEPWQFSSTGSGNISVIVDPNNNINETNELNNIAMKTVNLMPSYRLNIASVISQGSLIGYGRNPFPNAKEPYEVNITIIQLPENVPVSETIYLNEINGTTLLDPAMANNTKTIVTLNVPVTGLDTVIVPTPTNLNNYKMYISGLHFYNGTDVVTEIPLTVSSISDDNNPYVGVTGALLDSNVLSSIANDIGRVYYHLYLQFVSPIGRIVSPISTGGLE